MSNTLITHQMVARESAAILNENSPFIKNINTGRSGDFGNTVNGFNKGATVRISVPAVPVVYDGATFAGGATPTFEMSSVSLTVGTQKHVAIEFGAKERKLDVPDFNQYVLKPAMASLSAAIESDLIAAVSASVPGVVGTAGTSPAPSSWNDARSYLERFRAPTGNRSALLSSAANASMVSGNRSLFHDSSEIKGEFDDGAVGRYAGFNFFESQDLDSLDVNASTGHTASTSGTLSGSSVTIAGTGSAIIKAGQSVTIAGLNATDPLTGNDTGNLLQLVVTADVATNATSMAVYPAIDLTTSTHIGNCVVSGTASASAAVKAVAASSKTGLIQNLAFHHDAIAAAFVPLPIMQGTQGHVATINNVSVRVETGGDFKDDSEGTRIDVLYGWTLVRPHHIVRVTS